MIPFNEYYWLIKRSYPGCDEFTLDNFWLLPYEYVLDAVLQARIARNRELHENEVPIAMLACQKAEMNRDRKTRKKPYNIADFYCFNDPDNAKDTVSGVYGAAARALIAINEFPTWGLFVYKELMENADDGEIPEILCFQSDDAIILAPTIDTFNCKGMLIALESASRKVVSMVSPCNKHIRIRLPEVRSKVVAIENCIVDIIH